MNSSKNEHLDTSDDNGILQNNKLCPQSKRKNSTDDERQTKRKINDLYKCVTVDELNDLKETQNLYNNNLFRLQIQELLSEIRIKNKYIKQFTTWLTSFKKSLQNIPDVEIKLSDISKMQVPNLKKYENFVKYVTTQPQLFETDNDIVLNFSKPESVETFGLYHLNSLPGPTLSVNLAVMIPRCCVNVKDFLNNRYFAKRYYYLLYIAEYLEHQNICSSLSFQYHQSNKLLPIIHAVLDDENKILIKIYIIPPEDYFKPSRFLPKQNNVKANFFEDMKISNSDILQNTPTLMYNCSLLHDVTLTSNNFFYKTVFNDLLNVQEGMKLLWIWIKQRELQYCLSEEFVISLMAYLIVNRKLNKHMSSYQIVRNVWSFICSDELINSTLSICEDISLDDKVCFEVNYAVRLLDKSGCYNIPYFMDKDDFKKIKVESELAIKFLDDSRLDSFHSLFITKIPFCTQFDLILEMSDNPLLKGFSDISDIEKTKYIGHHKSLEIKYIKNILHCGLKTRITNIVTRIDYCGYHMQKLQIGINLNPDCAFNFVEIGPPLNDHIEADKFRKFWGKLSTDRRYNDGSTCTAVVFNAKTIKSKRDIIRKIIDFLLRKKLNVMYKMRYNEFENVLVNKKIIASFALGTNEEASLKIIKISDDLGAKIRNLQMSLRVTGIHGISDVFSYTDVFPQISSDYSTGQTSQHNKTYLSQTKISMLGRFVQPVECVVQLEHSSKWPGDLEALRDIKTSFYMEISKLLWKNFSIKCHVTCQFLEVFYEGVIFRYTLCLPKEIGLMLKEINEKGITKHQEETLITNMEMQYNILPRLRGALKGLQSQNPSYGPGTALIKRWLRSQLLDDYHMPDIVIDLLNASLFLNHGPYISSNTPQIAFIRFLKFFSEFDWNLQALVVNFNDDLSSETITEIENRLQEKRDLHQPLYIIMPYDKGESIFTKNHPTEEILFRIKELANGTIKYYENPSLDINNLFVPNWDGYNVVIHLRPLLNPRRHEQVIPIGNTRIMQLEKYTSNKNSSIPITNFNPVQIYLKELRDNYGEYAFFFHDTYGGCTVGVLWKPKVYDTKEFKVTHMCARHLSDNQLIFNVDAVIEDFYVMGKDLVKSIEKR